jgi:hypothetical protein
MRRGCVGEQYEGEGRDMSAEYNISLYSTYCEAYVAAIEYSPTRDPLLVKTFRST